MKTLQVSDHTKCNSARRPSFKPLLEDALQVLKGPLHNPEAKDFRKIISVMKNCYFFRENFSSQVALSEFVELAKFYVGYEVHKYGTVLLNDKEYADKLCVILDGSVEKIFQKPYGEVEEQIKEKRRRASCSGLDLSPPLKAKIQLPSLKSPRVLESIFQSPEGSLASLTRISTPKANSISSQPKKVLRLSSQQRDFRVATLEDEVLPQVKSLTFFEDLMKFIVNKKPEMKKKYFTEDILRAEKVKTLNTGDYFGESFCVQNHPKSNYMFAVSSPEAHLLTLNKEDYNEVMRQLESRNYKKLEAFIKLFPLFEKEEIQRFSEYFSQKSFQADEVIYFQGASAQDLYIVQSGEIQLLRKPAAESRGGSSGIPIASVVKDQIFGEEVLLFMETRQESAIANVSNTSVFVLQASLIPEIEGEFENIFTELRKRAEEKFQWRQKKAKELFEKSENNSLSSPEYSPERSLSPTKDIMKSLFNPRHSIQIPNRRSFILEKSSNSASNLPSSLASIFTTVSPRKLSDGQLSQKAQKSELYKSRFGRASVISDLSQITRPGERITSFQPANLSPVSDLKAMNFRNDLYGGNGGKNSPKKMNGNSQDTAHKKTTSVSNIMLANNQTPFKIMIKKRVAN